VKQPDKDMMPRQYFLLPLYSGGGTRWGFCVLAGLLALVFGAVSYLAVGPNLGLFIAGFFTASIITPALCSKYPPVIVGSALPTIGVPPQQTVRNADPTCSQNLLIALSVWLALATTWSAAFFTTPLTPGQFLQLVFLLLAFQLALTAARTLLPASLVTLLAIAWLSWPVWLATFLRGASTRTIYWLVQTHPPLVANGVLTWEPPWSERSLAYRRLTNLNQDVMYQLPTSAWRATIFLLLVAAGLMLVRYIARRMGSR